MSLLHEIIATRVDAWRAHGYPCTDYPEIAEILQFAFDDERNGQLRYLRKVTVHNLPADFNPGILGLPPAPQDSGRTGSGTVMCSEKNPSKSKKKLDTVFGPNLLISPTFPDEPGRTCSAL